MTHGVEKPVTEKNPSIAMDRNLSRKGEKFEDGDFDKKTKTPVDANVGTDEVKTRHVELATPVRVDPTILDSNQYILEEFAAFQKVPALEAEVELQKLRRKAVETQFRFQKERIRELELELRKMKEESESAWLDEEPVKPVKKSSKPKVVEPEVPKQSSKPKKPVEEVWSDEEEEEPVKPAKPVKKSSKPAPKKEESEDWSEEEEEQPKPEAKSKKPASKKPVDEIWSDEEEEEIKPKDFIKSLDAILVIMDRLERAELRIKAIERLTTIEKRTEPTTVIMKFFHFMWWFLKSVFKVFCSIVCFLYIMFLVNYESEKSKK